MENPSSLVALIASVITWLIIVALVLFIPRNRKPSSAIAWLLIIFFLPVVGLILFALIGSPKLSKRRQQQQKVINKKLNTYYNVNPSTANALKDNNYQDIVNLNKKLGGLPVGYAESVTILPEYNKAIADITESIKNSRKTVYIEYFIIALDEVTKPLFDALAEAATRGVEVKVLFDAIGSRKYPQFAEMKEFMSKNGIEWRPMLPIKLRPKNYNRPDLRNHRKVVAIDGNIGYIGSQNMIDRTYHRKDDIYYDELVAKVTGDCVEHFEIVFASDWYFETNEMIVSKQQKSRKKGTIPLQLVPSGSTYSTENNALLFAELIHKAQSQVVITNPYFVPNEAIFDAIISAAYRGVDVKIVNSQAMDQWMVGHAMRSFYSQLLKAGVEIYLFKDPKLLHSKHITVDDDLTLIGSSNMDIRSFELNLECVMVVYDEKVTKELKKVEVQNIKNSTKVTQKEWSKRSFWQELRDSIARLTSAVQ